MTPARPSFINSESFIANNSHTSFFTPSPAELLISHSIAAEASSTITARLAPRERHPRPTLANSRERDVLDVLSILLSLDVRQPCEFQRLNSPRATSLTRQPGPLAYDAN